ncbi:MAG TPA: PLD nuclease N-terminal domain-containing protein [Anaerolineales bacterium]
MQSTTIDLLKQLLPLLIPIVLIQLVLMVYCLVDLAHREQTNGPKWLWALLIIFGELLGPIAYLIIGRKE